MALDRLIGEDGKIAYVTLGDEHGVADGVLAAYPDAPTGEEEQLEPTWYEIASKASGDIPAWADATVYTAGQVVESAGVNYRCIVAHTSADPGDADTGPPLTGLNVWSAALGADEAPSAFGKSILGDLVVGYGQGLNLISDTSEDSVKPLTVTDLAEIVSWEFAITRPEIDLTALLDEDRRFRYGRDDWSGTLSGIVSIAQTELQRRFVREIRIEGSGDTVTHTLTSRETSSLAFFGYIQKRAIAGDEQQFLYLPVVELGGWTFGATDGARQEFSSGMRLGDDLLRRPPTKYTREIPSA